MIFRSNIKKMISLFVSALVINGCSGGGSGGTSAVPSPAPSLKISKVLTGGSVSCVLFTNGKVKCWGKNDSGQLGLGDSASRGDEPNEMGDNLPAIDFGTGRTAKSISVGNNHVCALLDNDSVKCWGNNVSGQLGQGDQNHLGNEPNEMGDNLLAVDLGSGRTAKAISSGYEFNCALLDNDTVKCWGRSSTGGLGLGDGFNRGDNANEMGDNLPAVDLGTGRTAKAISLSGQFACAILDNDSVKCWGYNFDGILGLGDSNHRGDNANEMGDNLPAVDLGTGRTAKKIASGNYHSCVILDNDSVKCWGINEYGTLGLGDEDNRGDGFGLMGDSLPSVDLGAGRTAKDITAGYSHSCAILDDDSIKCWGYNGWGQLGLENYDNHGDGIGGMGDSLPVVEIGSGRTVKSISANGNTCVVLDNDSIKCWGLNDSGQLGLGDADDRGDNANEMGDNLPEIDL